MAEGLPVRGWTRYLLRGGQVLAVVIALFVLFLAMSPSAQHNAITRLFLLGVVVAVLLFVIVGEIVARWLTG